MSFFSCFLFLYTWLLGHTQKWTHKLKQQHNKHWRKTTLDLYIFVNFVSFNFQSQIHTLTTSERFQSFFAIIVTLTQHNHNQIYVGNSLENHVQKDTRNIQTISNFPYMVIRSRKDFLELVYFLVFLFLFYHIYCKLIRIVYLLFAGCSNVTDEVRIFINFFVKQQHLFEQKQQNQQQQKQQQQQQKLGWIGRLIVIFFVVVVLFVV